VVDLLVEDPPIEEVIDRAFTEWNHEEPFTIIYPAIQDHFCHYVPVPRFAGHLDDRTGPRTAGLFNCLVDRLQRQRRQHRKLHYRAFVSYFIILMLVNQFTYTWVMFDYEYRIREGFLSFALLKPVHPIHSDIADNIMSKSITCRC